MHQRARAGDDEPPRADCHAKQKNWNALIYCQLYRRNLTRCILIFAITELQMYDFNCSDLLTIPP